MMNDQVYKVVFDKIPPVKKSSKIGIPFVATDQPKVKGIGKLIKYLPPFLYCDKEVEIFSPSSIVPYRIARKIKDYIVRSKLYPTKRSVGCQGSEGLGPKCVKTKITDTVIRFTTKKHP